MNVNVCVIMSVSATEPDWSRERKSFFAWNPGRSLLGCIRQYQQYKTSKNVFRRIFLRRWVVLRYRFWSIVTGADIPLTTQIGGGLMLPHPNGIVIHPEAKIGPNCIIFQQVTIGTSNSSLVPVIGGHVDIGAGAKLLGAILVGSHVEIGANAVVLRDVPDDHIAVGVPAVVKNRKG
jgi:serine O-acetyltransferase